MRAAGVPVGVCVTPMLPLADPAAFVARLAAFRPDVLVTQDFHDSNGGFGADTAAPMARRILATLFGVKHDGGYSGGGPSD